MWEGGSRFAESSFEIPSIIVKFQRGQILNSKSPEKTGGFLRAKNRIHTRELPDFGMTSGIGAQHDQKTSILKKFFPSASQWARVKLRSHSFYITTPRPSQALRPQLLQLPSRSAPSFGRRKRQICLPLSFQGASCCQPIVHVRSRRFSSHL